MEVLTTKWPKGASVETIDEMIEKDTIEEFRQIPMDRSDASRLILYMKSLAIMTPAFEERQKIERVCLDLAISHGDVSEAMKFALGSYDDDTIVEVFRLCITPDMCPKPERLTERLGPCPNGDGGPIWTSCARLTYGIEDGMSEEWAREASLRKGMRFQLAHQISRHKMDFGLDKLLGKLAIELPEEERNQLDRILRREFLPEMFQFMAKELEVDETRSPEDIFKTDQEDNKKRMRTGAGLDAARSALASAYVSAFVHCGFKADELLSTESSAFIQKAKLHGLTAATAGIGLISMWDVEHGLGQIDRFQYSSDPHTRAGAMLAFGLNTTNVANECDPVLTLVADSIASANLPERLTSYTALGYAYAGTCKAEVSELLVPIVLDLETLGGLEASSMAALALGFVFVGSGDENIAEVLLQTLLERAERDTAIDTIHVFNIGLALSLLFLEKMDAVEPVLAGLQAIAHPIGEFTRILLIACAYAGTGDVLKIQEMIQTCIQKSKEVMEDDVTDPVPNLGEPTSAANETAASGDTDPVPKIAPANSDAPPPTTAAPEMADTQTDTAANNAKTVKEDLLAVIPALAVLALPLISVREEIGNEMLFRLFNHFLQFDGLFVRRAVPIALALHSASNPRPAVVEMLSKLSHDADADTALHAIVALGVIGAGTNNARVAQLLRQLAVFYSSDSNALFLVRLSQGLLYTGKGLMSLSPLHTDRHLIDRSALAGLTAFCTQALFTKDTLCQGRYHLNIYHLVPAIYPRWLVTLDETLKPVAVTVRVGNSVDTAGVAGDPKSITGFRTHLTPVLLAHDERAQMGTDEWHPLTDTLEGIVIVRKLDGRLKQQAAKSLD